MAKFEIMTEFVGNGLSGVQQAYSVIQYTRAARCIRVGNRELPKTFLYNATIAIVRK